MKNKKILIFFIEKMNFAKEPFQAALITGAFTSTLFNPFDHALFLSMIHNREFLLKENFLHPFKGYKQAIFHRIVSNSFYFLLQEEVKRHILKETSTRSTMISGAIVGGINGATGHFLSAVKLAMWSLPGPNHTFRSTFQCMVQTHGLAFFKRALHITVLRDVKFGVIYELGRFHGGNHFSTNIITAGLASIIVSPWNYVKVMKFSHDYSPHDPRFQSKEILKNLFIDLFQHPRQTLLQKLCLGFGTLRVALGMSLGQICFDFTLNQMESG